MSRPISRRAFLGAGAAASAFLTGCAHVGARPGSGTPSDTAPCDGDETFHNWARTISCKPERFCQPETEQQVVGLVKEALSAGKRVRTVGAGHSWSPLVLTRDVLVNLDRMQEVTANPQAQTATMQAGIRLKNLTPRLSAAGLGLANLGSIREQSIAGATATGTHGTGIGIGSLSTLIVGLKLVTGTGDVLTVTEKDGDLFHAARTSLGALGIITEVTLRCLPDYELEYTAYLCAFEDVLEKLEALVRQNVRVRLWWLVPPIGSREHVIVTTMNPLGTAPGVLAEASGPPRTGKALPQDTEGLMSRSGSGIPKGCKRLLHFTGNYVKVLTVPLAPILHRECEYAVPVARTAEALRAFKRVLEEGNLSLKLPVEVRFVARDANLLSTARTGEVCYIGASTQDNANEVFQRFEPIMKQLGGRPHWGKCFSLTREEVRALYPDTYETFRKIRSELDPKSVFANDLVQRLFV